MISHCRSAARRRLPLAYNHLILRRILLSAVVAVLLSSSALPQTAFHAGRIVLVIPFENTSKSPGIEWIGEAFSEVLGNRLSSAQLFAIRREDRVYAFDRLGIPANIRPSRATLFRMAEEMDVDLIVLGSYNFDGRSFTARSQLLDVKRVHLSPESVEAGGLAQLVDIQNAIAWDLQHELDPNLSIAKNGYLAAQTPIRLDALENFVRGNLATDLATKLQYYKQAVKVTPDYSQAIFQLGKTYFDDKQYEQAAAWFAKVPRSDALTSEANFYLGMSEYYTGNFDKAEQAFSLVAERVPLIEVYNDLGVVESRRGKKTAMRYFDRVVQADSRDEDYRFNLAIALYRNGDAAGATKQLKEALSIQPQDAEAKSFLDAISKSPSGAKPPLERIKRNYDETSYRQLAMEIQNANEERHAHLPPAEHAAMHAQRGQEFLQQGLFDQAESEYREAILVDQNSVEGHAGLARVLEERDELTEARTEATAANRIKFTPANFITLAKIDLKQNKADAARDNVDRALKLDPNNAEARDMQKTIALQSTERPQSTQKNQP